MTDHDLIGQASKALDQRTLRLRWDYYKGTQPRVWITPKLRELFRTLADSMSENYCDLAIHARTSRMEVTGWEGPSADAAETLWDATRMGKRQADFYRWGLVYGHAYLIVSDEDQGPVIAPNRPTLVWHLPSQDDPTVVEVAVKEWWTPQGWRANVYDETEIRRYRTHDLDPNKRPEPAAFVEDTDDPGGSHGFDTVPVVPAYPYGMDAPVLIDSISPVQDRINKIGSNKMIAAEFGAFRQRVFFTRQQVTDNDLKAEPDTAIILDPGDPQAAARVQEMSATDLANYDNAKAAEVDALFTIALLPRHLRISGSSAEAPSGASIKADEGPMVEAILDHQREFGEAYEDALALLRIEAEPVWRDPVSDNEVDQAATVRAFTDAGVPLAAALRRYAGWSDDDVAEMGGEPQPTGAVPIQGAPQANATGAALLQAFAAAPTEA